MEDKLKQFLDEAFKPYGNFPARKDVEQELLANLLEKYNDLKASGKSEDEAYQATIDSFGDVTEIMEHVDYPAKKNQDDEPEDNRSIGKTLKETFKEAKK